MVVGYALNLSAEAASYSFAPARSILLSTAAAMYMFGVPVLLIGGCLALNVYMQRNPNSRIGSPRIPITPEYKKLLRAAESDSLDVVCPDCGFILGPELGKRKPDGSVVCGRCSKSFIP
ncbi:MAG: hypothetical protein KGD60_01260 [Candidatus Thorarchaeota archaeon]|nr:hypothetical protein [Candidatus Thorarchaeota archaeon]